MAPLVLHLLEPGDIDMCTGDAQRPAVLVTQQNLASTEQPDVLAAAIEIAILGVEVFLATVGKQLAQMAQALQIIRVYALVDFAQRQVTRAQAETPHEALTEADGERLRIDLPEAFGGALKPQLQDVLRLVSFMLTGLELFARLLNGPGQATDLGNMAVRHRRRIVALPQAGRHVDDAVDGLSQLVAKVART